MSNSNPARRWLTPPQWRGTQNHSADVNEAEFAALPLRQIVSVLADLGPFNSFEEDCICWSECSFGRVFHAHGQVHPRGRARQSQNPKPLPRLRAVVPIRCGAGTSPTCPPPWAESGCTSTWWWTFGAEKWWPGSSPNGKTKPIQRIWWGALAWKSRSGTAENPHFCSMPSTATRHVRTCWRAVWRSWVPEVHFQCGVWNDTPYSESPFRTAKCRPQSPIRPFTSKEIACQWVASFVR